MNSEPNSEIPPPLDSHHQGLQITPRVGRKRVGSLVGGLGAQSVNRILHENVGSILPLLDFCSQGLQIALWTGQQAVGSSVDGLGAHSVY